MSMEGVDYAGRHPTPAQLKAAGKTFACRYFGAGGDWKHADKAECDALRAAGIAVVTNVEGAADGLLGGFSAGRYWATVADAAARAAGMPPGKPIYLSADFRADSSHWGRIDDALMGAASVIGRSRVGVYGSYATVDHCVRSGSASWFWQTYAWSGGLWHASTHLRQYRNGVPLGSGTVDLVAARRTDYGQWGVPMTMPLPPGARAYSYVDIPGRFPVLRKGDSDDRQGGTRWVTRAQRLAGMAPSLCDGVYGPITATTIKNLSLGGRTPSSLDGSVIGEPEWRKLLGVW